MKVAISAMGNSLETTIDERFGRGRYFVIVDTTDMHWEAVENTDADLSSSAGIQSASFVASKNVDAVITGNCGPKAMQVFAETDIQVLVGQHGSIKAAVDRLAKGELQTATEGKLPGKTELSNTAMQRSRLPGMGRSGGRQMGGCGRGMGRGQGMGRRCGGYDAAGTPVSPRNRSASDGENDRDRLQWRAEDLKRQLGETASKIKTLA